MKQVKLEPRGREEEKQDVNVKLTLNHKGFTFHDLLALFSRENCTKRQVFLLSKRFISRERGVSGGAFIKSGSNINLEMLV